MTHAVHQFRRRLICAFIIIMKTPNNSDSASSLAPLVIVTAYDKDQAQLFRRLRRKKWAKGSARFLGEWNQTMYHQGNLYFRVRWTEDGRFWALYTAGFGKKIEAVVEATRKTCLEEVAAEALQAVEDADGPYINMMVDYDDLYLEPFNAYRRAARERSRERKQELRNQAEQAAAARQTRRPRRH